MSKKKIHIKVGLIAVALYLGIAITMSFLMGEQLRLRASRGDVEMLPATAATIELAKGNKVEQTFTPKIQRLEKISLIWCTLYRKNVGTVNVSLYRADNNVLIMQQSLNMEQLVEGTPTTMLVEKPVEGLYDVELRLCIESSDAVAGSAIAPLINTSTPQEGVQMYLNGVPTVGTLCFTAEGTDYIWTGLHYWQFVVGFGLILAAGLLYLFYCDTTGKKSVILNAISAIHRYGFLIRQMVSRDFKTKYKRSILGVFWSFLNPLLTMAVQYFIFSTLFKNDIPYFAVYLLIGVVVFNFFSEACGMTLTSVLGNAGLIRKVYVPKYIYPLTRVISSMVNLLISLVPLIVAVIISGVPLRKAALLTPYALVCLVIFTFGLGLLLSTMMVFFRDTQFLWSVISMVWMYATPIFYPETILPETLRFILKINPLYHFIGFARKCILEGVSPEPVVYVQCALIALGMLVVGAFVFKKNQDKFILYL